VTSTTRSRGLSLLFSVYDLFWREFYGLCAAANFVNASTHTHTQLDIFCKTEIFKTTYAFIFKMILNNIL